MLLKSRDFLSGLLILLIGVFLMFVLIPVGVDEPAGIEVAALSPAFYPRLVAVVMIILGLSISIKSALGQSGVALAAPTMANALKVGIVFIVLFITAYSIGDAGLVLPTVLALAILMVLAGERNPVTIILSAVLVPTLLYLFFTKLANIPIPAGPLDSFLMGI